MALAVGKHDVGAQLALGRAGHEEVHEENAVHRLDGKPPVGPTLALPRYGTRQVIDGTLAEIGQLAVLHLDDELLTAVVGAVDVVDDAAVVAVLRQLLLVEKTYVLHPALALKQRVEETDEQVFVYSCPNIRLKPTSVNG